MNPTRMYVLSFHCIPIACAGEDDRERLVEQMSLYTPEQQKAMTISDPIEVLK